MTYLALSLRLVLAVAAAQARPPSKSDVAEAHRRFQRATELYEENNLPGALAEFRRAYALAPNYKVLYNIGQLCFLVQDYPCAYTSFSRYLAEGGSELPADRREEVQREVSRLQGRVARLRIVVDRPGAEVSVDDVAIGRTPLPDPVLVAAGRPKVQVALSGYAPVSRVVEVAGQETANVEIELISETPVQVASGGRPAAVERARPSRPIPVVPWVVTGVLAAGAGITGGLALWSSSDLKNTRQGLDADVNALDSKSTRTKRLALATDVLLGSAVVAAAVATYFTVASPSERVAIAVTPGGLLVSGAF